MSEQSENKSLSVQQSRISEAEKSLIQNTFGDREELLMLVRDLFFGFELNEVEVKSLTDLFNIPGMKKLLRKIFLPQLEKGIPLGQSLDLWMTVKLDQPDMAITNIGSRKLMMNKLENALSLMDEVRVAAIDLVVRDFSVESLLARSSYIAHIELQLQVLKVLANTKNENSFNKKNSNK